MIGSVSLNRLRTMRKCFETSGIGGVAQIDLLVSDGLGSLENALHRVFPGARHQNCRTHLQRTVERHLRAKDRKEAQSELKEVCQTDTTEEAANERLGAWLDK